MAEQSVPKPHPEAFQQSPRLAAILPVSKVSNATEFFSRMGFSIAFPPSGKSTSKDPYRILLHENLSEIHLQLAPEDWLVPDKNPFGLYFYTTDVEALAEKFKDEIIGDGKAEHKEWNMYEFAVNGPDGVNVRIGWPSKEIQKAKGESDA